MQTFGEKTMTDERIRPERPVRPATFTPYLPNGVISADELCELAQAMREKGAKTVKLTGEIIFVWESDSFPGESPASLKWQPSVFKGTSVRSVKMCSAETFCQRYKNDVFGLATEIDKRFRGIELSAKLAIGVAGCRRSCSEPSTKDIGIVGRPHGYLILVGGSAGFSPRVARSIGQVATTDDVLTVIERTIAFSKSRGGPTERLGAIIEKTGMETYMKEVFDGIPISEPEGAEQGE